MFLGGLQLYDLVIIGGGVWGTAAALAAVEARHGSVLLLEANPYVAGESSAKAGGIVTDLVWNAEDLSWVTRSRELFAAAQRWSEDNSMIRHYGMLTLFSQSQAELVQRRADGLLDKGIPAELWDLNQIVRTYPELDRVADGVRGLWTPNDWYVNPTAYATATLSAAVAKGLSVKLSYRVKSIQVEDSKVLIEGPGETLVAAKVLVAAGTWTRKLVQTAGLDIPLRPYRVQLASLNFPVGHHLPILWELVSDMYIVPDGEHNLLAGDGTQLWEHNPDDYQTTGDDAFKLSIAQGVIGLSSRAEQAGLRSSWAGLCGGTPDRRPLLGAVTDRLYVACGDEGFGVMRGPAIGELAARLVAEDAAVPHLNPNRHPSTDFTIRPGFTLEE
ncbi:FAD-binding oxidoreductase [Alicyclobacillaceae bacterium I2511]|nr:FAD-binding oxidoreductase [Alicyclobacillaceae bacterium I2511]